MTFIVKPLIFHFSCIVNDHGKTIWFYICHFQEEIVLENIMFVIVIAKLVNSSSRMWPGVGENESWVQSREKINITNLDFFPSDEF